MAELTDIFSPRTKTQRTFLSRTEVRFWERVRSSPGCWEWTGARFKDPMGYGAVCVLRKLLKAHRLSWMIHFGAIPDDLCVLHSCDNPICVRPDHLFLGTVLDNNLDRDRKGRMRPPHSERHWNTTLTEKIVRALRRDYDELIARRGKYGAIPTVAAKYGLPSSQVAQIVRRRRWLHVDDAPSTESVCNG